MIRYLRNHLVRGLLVSGGIVTTYLLLINSIEYFAYLPGNIRLAMLIGFLFLLAYALILKVILPAYRLVFFRRFMTREQAARIIGERLPEVSDKLLNLLQLGEEADLTFNDNSLLAEAIRQKTDKLSIVPFTRAIDWAATKKLMQWSLIPIAVMLLILLTYPSFLVSPSNRILKYTTVFEKPLPFSVFVVNPNLETVHNVDFVLEIKLSGEEIPQQFFVLTDGMKMEMKRNSSVDFSHTFRKVSRDISFKIIGGSYQSASLLLKVRSRPRLMGYSANLVYPAYLQREAERVVNPAFLSVPAGTRISWTFNTRVTDTLGILTDSLLLITDKDSNSYNYAMTATDRMTLQLSGSNKYMHDESLLSVRIDVMKDEYPTILVSDLQEETLSRKRFFTGFITDDYGFSRLSVLLNTSNVQDDKPEEDRKVVNLFLQAGQLRENFYFALDLDSLMLVPGKKICIQFRVTDNDLFSGPKSALSQVFAYQIPSMETLDSLRRDQEQSLEKKLVTMQQNSAALKRQVQEMNRKMLSKTEPDQNDRSKINELVKQQLSLQEQMEQLRRELENINRFNKENELLNEKLLEKQAMIDKLIEDVLPEDLRKMMEDLEKLLEKVNKDQISDFLKKMEMSNEKMEKMLDRNLALLKHLQLEKEMNALMDRLEKLAEDLKMNAESTTQNQESRNLLQEKLNEIGEKFGKERSALDSLRKENNKLEQPFSLDDTGLEEEQIERDIDQGAELLNMNDRKGSSAKQQEAAGKMKKLKDQLMSMIQMSEEEQLAEDARLVRYLLENVLRISFGQEELINQLSRIRRDDPAYSMLSRNQSMLLESFRVVEDSLTALAKRQPMVGNFVLDEVSAIKFRIVEVQDKMKERLSAEAASSQQFAMMSMNNLALMLAESLKNMEESMGMPSSESGKGKSKRPMPGNTMQKMREMQEALGKQLQEMMQGKQQGRGKSGMSEEIARMAANQEAIRQQMRILMDQLKSEGQMGDIGLNKTLEEMEKLEERLVNKYLDEQALRLQRNIEVRMLESEKALKEKEKEERRESYEFKGENIGNLINNLEYNRIMKQQMDMLRTNPIDLQPFLRDRAREYFIRFNQMKNNAF